MNLRDRLSKKEFNDLYTNKHLSMQEIANLYGCSKTAISNLAKEYEIKSIDGEQPIVKCAYCKSKYRCYRRSLKKNQKNYCSRACYLKARKAHGNKDQDYRHKRQYLRIARKNYEAFYAIKLKRGEVIHHIDGNILNNKKENLMKFESQSEHLKFHHKQRIEG